MVQSLSNEKQKEPLNVVVLGAAGVGKSAIISQFLHHKFPQQSSFSIELEKQKCYLGKGDKKRTLLNIVDTPGGYCFNYRRRMAIESGDAFVLVFSLDDEDSFMTAAMIKDDIVRFKPKNTPILLVGNKADVEAHTRITSKKGASLFAKKEWKTKYVETSAKGLNVGAIFRQILKLTKKKKCMCLSFDSKCFPRLPVCLRRKKKGHDEGTISSF